MNRLGKRKRSRNRRESLSSPWMSLAESTTRFPSRFRRLNFEPLEIRLPLAGNLLSGDATEIILWQGREVEVLRGEWIVQIENSEATGRSDRGAAVLADIESKLLSAPKQLDRNLDSQGHYLFQLSDELSPEAALNELSKTPGFQYAEPNFVVSVDLVPNDPRFNTLWGLHQGSDTDIDAPEAWDLTTGSNSLVVGVIDTGVDYTHEDLAANIWTNPAECPAGIGTCLEDGVDDDGNGYVDDFYGWDFLNNDNDPFDDNSHGTHVAGTIAAVGDNGIGVVGVNWNAQIMALKAFGANGVGSTAAANEAIEYATMMRRDHGVDIRLTNNSWGGAGFSQAQIDSIQAAGQQNMLFVAAAGNQSVDTDVSPHYPASYDLDNIVSVASTTSSDGLSSFSNTGLTNVDLGAPGSSIYSALPNGKYGYKSGTSMASPHVAGVAALAWATDPGASYTDVRDAILSSVDSIAALQGVTATGGRLNALGAIQNMGLFATPTLPTENEVVDVAPTLFTLDFSHPVDSNTVEAGDFSVGGISADSVNILDADTVEFTFATSPVSVEGPHVMTLAADSVLRLSDADGVAPLSIGFFFDPTPLRVTTLTPVDGSVLTLPDPVVRLDFSEAVAPGSIDIHDLSISAGRVGSATVIDADTVEYRLAGFDHESYLVVTLPSASVVDAYGMPNQSFAATFLLDFDATEYPGEFSAIQANGSLIYESALPGQLQSPADTDTYTLELEAGQSLSAVMVPSAGLAGRLKVFDPNQFELATPIGAIGESVVVQSVPISAAGVYTVVVETDGSSTGSYDLELYLNLVLEDERYGGNSNDSRAAAQDANPGWTFISPAVSRLGIGGSLTNAADEDWYELSLSESQATSVVLQTLSPAAAGVTLHASSGTQLAAGTEAGDDAVYIHDFVPAASESYFLRVSGDTVDYTLTATHGTAFDNNTNDDLGTAHEINATLQVLGHVGRIDPSAAGVDVAAISFDASMYTDLGNGVLFPNELLEGAVVQEEEGQTKIIWDEPQDPRVLMSVPEVSANFVSIDLDPEGDLIHDVIFTPDGSKFLIAFRETENVIVYDAATYAVEADIHVSGQPVSLAVTPDGQYALSANTTGNTVTVIDLATLSIATEIPISSAWPFRVKVTADGEHAVVASADDAYGVISMATLQEVRSIPSPGLGVRTQTFSGGRSLAVTLEYTDFAISPDSNTLVGPSKVPGQDSIRIYDLSTGIETAVLPTSEWARGFAINADGSKAYAASLFTNGEITEVDLTTNTVSRTFSGEYLGSPAIMLTPDEQFLIASGFNTLVFIDLSDGSTSASAGSGYVDQFALSYDGKYVLTRQVVDVATQSVVASLPLFPFLGLVAASPTEYVGIQAANTGSGGQSFSVVNIDGANSAVQAVVPGGSAPEGDTPTRIAISPDGLTAVTTNWDSNNASIIDLVNRTTVAWVDVGTRPEDVAITPDGAHALVSSPDDHSVTVINLATATSVATLTGLLSGPNDLLISDDGTRAFVATTRASDSLDEVYFVDLDGANSAVSGSLTIGDIGFFSEMKLSPDGSLLAVPIRGDDEIVLIDAIAHTEVARIPTGGSPNEVEFSTDGSLLYVMNQSGKSVTVIEVDGSQSAIKSSLPGLADPRSMVLGEAGDYLYVTSYNPSVLEVVDTQSGTIVQSIPISLDRRPLQVHREGNVLYLVGSGFVPDSTPAFSHAGHLMRVVADGPSSRFVDDTLLSGRAQVVDFSDELQSAVTVAYSADGIDIISYESEGTGDEDFYRFSPLIGDNLVISTLLPGNDAGDFANDVDIAIELYGPGETFIARSLDGLISHTVASFGEYSVRVYAQGFTEGEYLLTVSGVTPGPSLLALSPLGGETEVSPFIQLVVTFDENVEAASGNVAIMRTADDSVFTSVDVASGFVTISGSTVTIDPGISLEPDTDYYVLVDAAALRSIAGDDFVGISDKTLWSFSTAFGYDFGDAPGPLPTTAGDSGAHHVAVGPRLGGERDIEIDGLPSAGADSDDSDNAVDDEDGVEFGVMQVGNSMAAANVILENALAAKLDGWIDFDRDGVWEAAEKIFDSVDLTDVMQTLNFDLPADLTAGDTFARLRVSSAGELDPTGPAADGEVEDYLVTISEAPYLEIKDDGDADMTLIGNWHTVTGANKGHQNDFRWSKSGSGANTAEWSFEVPSGQYRISASWRAWNNRASDAPFTIRNGDTDIATVIVNQQVTPSDRVDAGTAFHDLGIFNVTNTQLLVSLTDQADGMVVADAIRVERLGAVLTTPEIRVTAGVEIAVGDVVDFGTVGLGGQSTKTFTVSNIGGSDLFLASLRVPAGFTLVSGFDSDTVPPTGSTTFTVRLDGTAPGDVGGNIGFRTNDDDERLFQFSLFGSVSSVAASVIIDNGDSDFGLSGTWGRATGNGKGHEQDFHWSSAGSGDDQASWNFDVSPGQYLVSASWRAWANRATDAPFTVRDGSATLATVRVNQQIAPTDTFDSGTAFADLGSFSVLGGQLVVSLSDDANGLVVADAIRIQRLGDVVSAPDVAVTVEGASVPHEIGVADFGEVVVATSVTKTIEVSNQGLTDLVLTEPIQLPSGFSLVNSFAQTTLPTGASTTFVIQLDTSSLGIIAGEVSFGSNDPDESPFRFSVTALVVPPDPVQVIDDGDQGFAIQGSWVRITGNGKGHGNDFHYASAGSGEKQASWTFAVEPGQYRVSVSWRAWSNRATNAPFTVFDDANSIGGSEVDQRVAASDLQHGGTFYQDLGTFDIVGSQLSVLLTNDADGLVVADAVRIERL